MLLIFFADKQVFWCEYTITYLISVGSSCANKGLAIWVEVRADVQRHRVSGCLRYQPMLAQETCVCGKDSQSRDVTSSSQDKRECDRYLKQTTSLNSKHHCIMSLRQVWPQEHNIGLIYVSHVKPSLSRWNSSYIL